VGRGRSASFLSNNFFSILLRFSFSLSPFASRFKVLHGCPELKLDENLKNDRHESLWELAKPICLLVSVRRSNYAAKTRSSYEESRWESSDIELHTTVRFYDAFMIYQKRYNREINCIAISSSGHISMASSHYTNCYIWMFRRQSSISSYLPGTFRVFCSKTKLRRLVQLA